MKVLFTITFFLIQLVAVAQADSIGLKENMKKLDQALLQKDEAALKLVLHMEASFGHSSGWYQSREEVLEDCRSGKLVYLKLENSNVRIVSLSKNRATVRMNTHAEGTLNGNQFDLSMHVMQVWIKTKKGWQLLARQSAKL